MALKEVVSQRVLNDIIGRLQKSKEWKVLVLDHLSTRIISSCCRMHEIMEKGITIVEALEIDREPLPHLEAIYIMLPTEQNVQKLISDFKRENEPTNLYKGIHIFFLQKCPPGIIPQLSQSEAAKRIYTLQEVNMAFLPYESRVFTLDFPDAFENYFCNVTIKKEDLFETIADQLATVCAMLGEYPIIRAWKDGNGKCADLASKLQDKLDSFKAEKPDLGKGAKQTSEFIILDRGFDVTTPVLHEVTFQCMVYDLLKPNKDIYKFTTVGGDGNERSKDVILDENDELWKKLRHDHIADVSRDVSVRIKEFSKKKKLGDPNNPEISVKALARQIRIAPQYQKELGQYSIHLNLARECMKRYQSGIGDLCAVEQKLALGTDEHGDPIPDALTLLNPFIFGRKYNVYDKIRLQILYILQKKGLTLDEFTTMVQQSEIPSQERSVIFNLMHLGVSIINGEQVKEGRFLERKLREETTYTDSRWSPVLRDILEYVAEGQLDDQYCSYIRNKPRGSSMMSSSVGVSGATSVRKQYDWIKSSDKKSKTPRVSSVPSAGAPRDLPTIFVFIVGGVTYSEIRTVYQMAEQFKNYDFLIGSTHIITPSEFLGEVRRLPPFMRM